MGTYSLQYAETPRDAGIQPHLDRHIRLPNHKDIAVLDSDTSVRLLASNPNGLYPSKNRRQPTAMI